jgi:hypothetical protein
LLTAREETALEACKRLMDKIELDLSSPKAYIVATALSEFLGGPKGGYHLVKAVRSEGDHYWVTNDYGTVLDPSRESLNGGKPPYNQGIRVAKRNTMVKHVPLLEAMQEALSGDERVEVKSASDIFGRPLMVEKEAALSEGQQKVLDEAWRALIKDWAGRPEEFIRCYYSKGALAMYFVRALLYGEEIPRTATLAYVSDRYYVAGSNYPFNELLSKALEDLRLLRGIKFVMENRASFHTLISSTVPISGYRLAADFPISLARDLINRYCPAGGNVLDPCHGWGGRMVGFMLSKAGGYVGIDPAPHSPKLQEMFDDLSKYLPESKTIKLINKPFEDVRLRDESYDFAFTSPPYYNAEKYQGEESSWRRYKSLAKWVEGFYRPLLMGVSDALKPGAAFALQVTPRFKMGDIAKKIGAEIGLEYDRIYDTSMRRYNSVNVDKAGSGDVFEVVLVFRRR